MTSLDIFMLVASMLGGLTGKELAQKDGAAVSLLSSANTAFGRMGKVAEKLLGMIHDIDNSEDKLTERDRREIRLLGQAIFEILQLTIRGYNARIQNISRTIQYYTEEIMALGNIIKSRFIQRVHEEGSQRTGSSLFTDICYTEEQLIDYCDMIADALIRYDRECEGVSHSRTVDTELTRNQIHDIFRDKFEALEQE